MSSYLLNRKRRARARAQGMGDVSSTIGTALDIANDPYIGEVICRIGQLKNIDHGEPVGACVAVPDGVITGSGIGLRNAIVPLRGYVYAQQNKWVYPLAILAVLGLPMLVGYELGKGAK